MESPKGNASRTVSTTVSNFLGLNKYLSSLPSRESAHNKGVLMKFAINTLVACALTTSGTAALAQSTAVSTVPAVSAPAVAPTQIVLPADTIIQVTPVQEITSIKMKEGDVHMLQVAADVAHNGVVVIPRGAPVKATVTWRTGKGIGGKSAKFEMTFDTVTVRGQQYALKGKHRQEGKGNTVGALLGSIWISGRSAIITSGQVVNAFTADSIPAA